RISAGEACGSGRTSASATQTCADSANAACRCPRASTAARDRRAFDQASGEAVRCGTRRRQPMTPDVTAILVNYNAGNELAVALRSIQGDCAEGEGEGGGVDNASSDNSAAIVETFPRATLIRNPANVG